MKKPYGDYTWVVWFAAAIIISALAVTQLGGNGELRAGEVIDYPLAYSVCCEETGANSWVTATQLKPTTYTQTYSCPRGTTQCRAKTPEVTCPGLSASHPLGYTAAWTMKVDNTQYCSLPLICQQPPVNGEEFLVGETVSYQGGCLDNLQLVMPSNPTALYSLISGSAWVPSTSRLDIEYINTMLYLYPSLEGKTQIDNTELCVRNDVVNQLAANSPQSRTLWEKINSAVNQILGKNIDDPLNSAKDLAEESTLSPGTCYRGVDKWISLSGYNKNPFGTYNGNEVLCDQSKGLFRLERVDTVGGVSHLVPTSRLSEPENFCCSNAWCVNTYGVGYGCSNYRCVQGSSGGCMSDVDCQTDLAGTCYYSSGFYKLRNSRCVSGVCVAADEVVACCPDFCSEQGLWCDYSTGCRPPVGQCSSHSYRGCLGKDVYFFDSCGNTEEKIQSCSVACDNGACVGSGGGGGGSCEAGCGWYDFPCYLTCYVQGLVQGGINFLRVCVSVVFGLLGFLVFEPKIKENLPKKEGGRGTVAALVFGALVGYVVYLLL